MFTFFLSAAAFAQDSIVIDKQGTMSWLQENWMWVAGGVLLLILILSATTRGRRTKKITTTTVQDDVGNVRKVTTTELED